MVGACFRCLVAFGGSRRGFDVLARWEAFGIGERYHCYYPTFCLLV